VLVPDLIALQSKAPLLHVGREVRDDDDYHIGVIEIWPDGGEYAGRLKPSNDLVKTLRNSLKWSNIQATLLDICIAFHPLSLPPYVILEIVDRFPFWSTHVNRKKKIDYIIQIKQFCDDLIIARNES
jgi:hypothetical protein